MVIKTKVIQYIYNIVTNNRKIIASEFHDQNDFYLYL